MVDRRKTFVPTLAVGVLAAALAAVGSSRGLMTLSSEGGGDPALDSSLALAVDGGQLPLATTLSMVVLAAWGVVLVTRGRVRFGVAILGALAAAGVLATVAAGWWLVPDALRDDAAAVGVTSTETAVTGWYWLTLAAALISAVASVAAVVLVRSWPEMGDKYDRPTGPPPVDTDDDLALWKALDEGRDPTA
jgi:hypothetical protein